MVNPLVTSRGLQLSCHAGREASSVISLAGGQQHGGQQQCQRADADHDQDELKKWRDTDYFRLEIALPSAASRR